MPWSSESNPLPFKHDLLCASLGVHACHLYTPCQFYHTCEILSVPLNSRETKTRAYEQTPCRFHRSDQMSFLSTDLTLQDQSSPTSGQQSQRSPLRTGQEQQGLDTVDAWATPACGGINEIAPPIGSYMFASQFGGLLGRINRCDLVGIGVWLGMGFEVSKAHARSSVTLSACCLWIRR